MSISIEMTVTERFRVIDIIMQQDGRGIDMVMLGKLYDALYPTEDERLRSGWITNYDTSGALKSMAFNPANDFSTVITLTDQELNRMKLLLESWDKFNFTRDRGWLSSLRAKLGMGPDA